MWIGVIFDFKPLLKADFMATLLDSIKSELSPVLIDKVSNYVNESRNNTTLAVTGVIPLLLAFLGEKSTENRSSVYPLLTDSVHADLFKNQPSFLRIFESKKHSLLSTGNAYILDLLRGNEESLFEAISKYANVSKVAASGILAIFLPLVINKVGRKCAEENIEESNLSRVFSTELPDIFAAIPYGLHSATSFLGFSISKAEETTPEPDDLQNITSAPLNKKKNTLWFILILLLIIISVILYFSLR